MHYYPLILRKNQIYLLKREVKFLLYAAEKGEIVFPNVLLLLKPERIALFRVGIGGSRYFDQIDSEIRAYLLDEIGFAEDKQSGIGRFPF